MVAFVLVFFSQLAFAAPIPETDLPLDKAIQMALENSHDIKKARETYEASEAEVRRVRGSFFPTVKAEMTAGTYHDRLPTPGDPIYPQIPRDRNAYLAQVTLSQNLFSGFRDATAFDSASLGRIVAEKDLEIAKLDIVQNLITLYFGAQLSMKDLQSEEEAKALLSEQWEEVKRKVQHGTATELAGLQVEYAMKSEIPKITELQAQLESKKLKLARLLGMELDKSFKLSNELSDVVKAHTELPPFADSFEYALKRNPHFAKYEAQISLIQASQGNAVSKHLPTLDLSLNAGTNAYQRYDIGADDSLIYGVELKLTVPLFSGLDSFAERSEWKSKLNAIKEERSSYRESLLDQLNDSYRQLELSELKIEAEKVDLVLTEKTVKQARDLYRVGRATLSDVLDAYNKSLEAKKSSAQASLDRVLAVYKIKALLGIPFTVLRQEAP